ncbi:MAG: dihydroorotate dehydrogenase-like protein [Bacteroidetes bacterium]|nr:MAG: dihydroorotate dehydrogenase-like protein [Bacteroidota bacterium]
MNLKTKYMGLELNSPLLVSSNPLSEKLDNIKLMEDHGAGAVVMFSLFEEQIRQENALFDYVTETHAESFAEALSYFPPLEDYKMGSSRYLELIRQASEAVDIPIIGSLNGITQEGWISYAKEMEEAGASGVELNIYFIPSDPSLDGRGVEQRYLDILKAVKSAVSIPVALKLNPYFSSMAHMAQQLDQAGADALVLFNRFYEPDINIDRLELENSLDLSGSSEVRLPLLWLGVLFGKVDASLAATTGVHSARDMIKYLLAGADVTMTASSLLKHGIRHLRRMLVDLEFWMEARNITSLSEMRGILSRQRVEDPVAYERANYIKILGGYRA